MRRAHVAPATGTATPTAACIRAPIQIPVPNWGRMQDRVLQAIILSSYNRDFEFTHQHDFVMHEEGAAAQEAQGQGTKSTSAAAVFSA